MHILEAELHGHQGHVLVSWILSSIILPPIRVFLHLPSQSLSAMLHLDLPRDGLSLLPSCGSHWQWTRPCYVHHAWRSSHEGEGRDRAVCMVPGKIDSPKQCLWPPLVHGYIMKRNLPNLYGSMAPPITATPKPSSLNVPISDRS